MKAAVLQLPVVCPLCGNEHLRTFAIVDLAPSLVGGTPIMLESTCHPCQWQANPEEREQIWQYLDALALTP